MPTKYNLALLTIYMPDNDDRRRRGSYIVSPSLWECGATFLPVAVILDADKCKWKACAKWVRSRTYMNIFCTGATLFYRKFCIWLAAKSAEQQNSWMMNGGKWKMCVCVYGWIGFPNWVETVHVSIGATSTFPIFHCLLSVLVMAERRGFRRMNMWFELRHIYLALCIHWNQIDN